MKETITDQGENMTVSINFNETGLTSEFVSDALEAAGLDINLYIDEIDGEWVFDVNHKNLTFTNDSIEDFKAARQAYNDLGRNGKETDTIYEMKNVQCLKGDQHKDVTILDLGSIRVAAKV